MREAGRLARGEMRLDRPWEAAIQARQAAIRATYADQAVIFERTGDKKLLAIAAQLRTFVSKTPVVQTHRTQQIAILRPERSKDPKIGREVQSSADRE